MQFHHIGVKCTNMDESLRFYTEVMGFEISEQVEVMGHPCIFLEKGGARIELESLGAATQAPAGPPNAGLTHFAFYVDDIEAVSAGLRARGAAFFLPPFKVRPTRKTAFIKGPDAVLIQLIQDIAG